MTLYRSAIELVGNTTVVKGQPLQIMEGRDFTGVLSSETTARRWRGGERALQIVGMA